MPGRRRAVLRTAPRPSSSGSGASCRNAVQANPRGPSSAPKARDGRIGSRGADDRLQDVGSPGRKWAAGQDAAGHGRASGRRLAEVRHPLPLLWAGLRVFIAATIRVRVRRPLRPARRALSCLPGRSPRGLLRPAAAPPSEFRGPSSGLRGDFELALSRGTLPGDLHPGRDPITVDRAPMPAARTTRRRCGGSGRRPSPQWRW